MPEFLEESRDSEYTVAILLMDGIKMKTDKENKNIQKIKEEFLQSTETLWNNEVKANKYVAHVLFITAGLALIVLVLSWLHVFSISNAVMTRNLGIAFFALVIPAVICLVLKGEKKWLKIIMLIVYTIVLCCVLMSLGHNVTLALVFPVILSVRYYSRPVTAFIAALTVVLAGFAEFFGVAYALGRLDLNMVELPVGTILQIPESMSLRDAVPLDGIDYSRLWTHTLQHSFLPKLILFVLIAIICMEIARRGRKAIFDQKAETQKTERLATELNLASEIQNNVLPNIFPVYPERCEFDLYASMDTAKEVGGDFYDFFMIDDDHIALVMADVSGKGVGAALFMMVARTQIKTRAQMGGSPSEILYDVNNSLCEGNTAELFVTVWLGILEISTGKGIAANAGHEHPAIRRKNGEYALVVYQHSPVMGAMEGIKYKEHEFEMFPGDSLFVYTDGVAEATNASNELFGTDRMLNALNRNPDAMPEEVLQNVKEDIKLFVNDAEQFDDITMLCIKYNGRG